MKLAAVFFLVLGLLISPAFAGTIVEKPDLPDGYESWPEKYQNSCAIDDQNTPTSSVFAKFEGR